MTSVNKTKKLAIYYGAPSQVNGSNMITAIQVLKDYDQLVLGGGLELPSNQDHDKATMIIQNPQMANTQVFGYIDSTQTISNIKTSVRLWKRMGVTGIFCDKFGYDSGTVRTKQNAVLTYLHGNNLTALVSALEVDDVLGQAVDTKNNPLGIPSQMNVYDWYISIPYQISNGTYQDTETWKTTANKMANYRKTLGIKMVCATTAGTISFDQSKMDYAYFSTILYNFDSFGWSEKNFSSDSNKLPFRERKAYQGTEFTGPIIDDSSSLNRQTNVGIKIDTNPPHDVGITL